MRIPRTLRSTAPHEPEVMRADDERELAEGLIAGSPGAVHNYLERVHHPVFCMASRLARHSDRARDWTHTVILAIVEELARGRFAYRHPGSFWAWFRKRAYYQLLDQYRRCRAIDRREQSGGDDPAPAFLSACGADDPVAELQRAELYGALEACLTDLPSDDQRRSLRLLLLEDQTYESIAHTMRAPLNTVRAWIRRGRVRLRECLSRRMELVGEGASRG
jgi:RNA polymerase sigma-70 factor (ECF subfamily)